MISTTAVAESSASPPATPPPHSPADGASRPAGHVPYFKVPVAVVSDFGPQIRPLGLAVYVALARRLNRKSGTAWPSYDTIAADIGASKRAVIGAMAVLRKLGLVRVNPSRGRRSNTYELPHLNGATNAPLAGGNGADNAPLTPATVQPMHPNGADNAPLNGAVNAPEPDTIREPSSRESTSSSEPHTHKNAAPRRRACEDDTDFNKFWAAYPRKAARPKAREAWAKLAPDEATVAAILAAVEAQKESEQWRVRRVIPNPAGWLTDRRWQDGPPPRPETWGEKIARLQGQQNSARIRGNASLYASLGTVAPPDLHPAGVHRVPAPAGKYDDTGKTVRTDQGDDTDDRHGAAPESQEAAAANAPSSPPAPTPPAPDPPRWTAYLKYGRGFGERVKVGTAGSEAEAKELAEQYQRDQGRKGEITVYPNRS